MKQMTDHIYYTDADPSTDLPFLFYIRGSRRCLQVDAGNSPASCQRFLHELEEIHLSKPDLLVLTHWHWDHTFGVCAASCPVISIMATFRKLTEVSTWEWNEATMRELLREGKDIPFTYEHILAEYEQPEDIQVQLPDLTFSSSITIHLGDLTCVLEHHDSPHTRHYFQHNQIISGELPGEKHNVSRKNTQPYVS